MQVSIPKFTNIGVLVPSAPARIIAYIASVAISCAVAPGRSSSRARSIPTPASRWASVIRTISSGSLTMRSASMTGSEETTSTLGLTCRKRSTRKAGVWNHICIPTRGRPEAPVGMPATSPSETSSLTWPTMSLIWPPTLPKTRTRPSATAARSSGSSPVKAISSGGPWNGISARGCHRSSPKR